MFNWFKRTSPVSENTGQTSAPGMPSNESPAGTSSPNEYATLKKQGNEFLTQGRLEDAAACYRQAVAINPGYAEGFLNLGFSLKEQELYEEAEQALKQAILLDAQTVDAYYLLGSIAQECGKPAAAIEYFKKALELKPDFEIVYGNLCLMLFQSRQIESAKKVIAQGLSIFPQSALLHCFLGNLYVDEKRLEEAIACYQKALLIQPDYAEALSQLGHVFYDQGELDEALACYRKVLSLTPDDPEAHNSLGLAFQALGNLDEALACFRKVLALNPDSVTANNNLGATFQALGKFDEAVACFRRALALKPDSFEANNNLGAAFQAVDNLDEAAACFQRALALKPDSVEAHNNLGNVYRKQRKFEEAEACIRAVLDIAPDEADSHNNMGALFMDKGYLDKAETCFHKALELNPDCTDALNNLGCIFKQHGHLNKAIAYYRKSLEIKPDFPETYNSLGNVLRDMGNLEAAQACYNKALELKPEDAIVYNNLGAVYRERLALDEAAECFSKAISFNPDYSIAHCNLGVVYQDQGKLDKALECYRQAVKITPESHTARMNMVFMMLQTCEWKDLELFCEEVRRGIRETTSPTAENQIAPFSLLAVPGSTPVEQRLCAENWAQARFQSMIANRKEMGFKFKRHPKSKLHVGYLSADYTDHPVAHLMAEVFETHDRERFRITAYSYGPDDDDGAMRKRLMKAFDNFIDIKNFTHESAARKIYEDQVDILVDLTGYTKFHRGAIPALRPVPLQVNYLGYAGTMGADFIDYLVADPFIITAGHQKYYKEKVKYLPDSYLPRDSSCRRLAAPSRKDCGLPDEGFVFCSFNPFYKITPEIFDIWCRLMIAVPESVLWLSSSNPIAESNLRREAKNRGVKPERIIRAPRMGMIEDHLARVQCADLFLDTTPYNAHTTCSDALWMGLPVITCAGETFPSRVAGGLLTALGVPELITYNLKDYYTLALELATDKNKYASIRNKVIANRDTLPLFDSTKFTRNLENIYRQMWDDYIIDPAK